MSRDDAYLVDILESAKIALAYVAGKSWDDFSGDIQCQDAVLRRLESSVRLHGISLIKLKRNILKYRGGI